VLGWYVGLFAALMAWTRQSGVPLVVVAPAGWVATEWLRGWPHVGAAWAPLGASQHDVALAQLAAVGGVPALSALVVLGNVAVARWIGGAWSWRRVAAVGALVAGVALWGALRVAALERAVPAGTVRLGLVQASGDEPRRQRVDPEALVQRLVALTRAVAATHPAVILWPETVTPFGFDDDPAGRRVLEQLVAETGVPLVFGSAAFARPRPDRVWRFNRVYLLAPPGAVAAHYDKEVLVPFGEYVPLARLLRFVRPLVTGEAPLRPGRPRPPFAVGGARLGVLLCYEVSVPALARQRVRAGAQVLVNLANDGWVAGTAASAQLLAQAQLRAIEERVPVVRVADHGPSAVVAPSGRVVWRGPPAGAAWHVADVGWPGAPTVYGRVGDVVVWAALAVTALALVAAGTRRLRKAA
jgi:apolipoprotein N-acyltransferase